MQFEAETIILFGNSGVGKTAVISRFVSNTFTYEYEITFVTEYPADGVQYRIDITDPFGEENEFQQIFTQYCRRASCIIIVYSIDNENSFNMIEPLRERILDSVDARSFPIVVCGNKTDLESQRVITTERREELCRRLMVPSIEVSALNGSNVEALFEMAARQFAPKKPLFIHTL